MKMPNLASRNHRVRSAGSSGGCEGWAKIEAAARRTRMGRIMQGHCSSIVSLRALALGCVRDIESPQIEVEPDVSLEAVGVRPEVRVHHESGKDRDGAVQLPRKVSVKFRPPSLLVREKVRSAQPRFEIASFKIALGGQSAYADMMNVLGAVSRVGYRGKTRLSLEIKARGRLGAGLKRKKLVANPHESLQAGSVPQDEQRILERRAGICGCDEIGRASCRERVEVLGVGG